ncbi:transcription termination factor MTERF9, chloroplastic-like [Arachis ipaensis]|uniref:transcription termination factor MTERF9, chloroplastic-like n=1 Tax=Arachis ipaensis TaxID=130454 RepID=UPI0007AFD006|nr:transcription termination factor MTERF9, chloroplastic-like [Arachis ipaensis]
MKAIQFRVPRLYYDAFHPTIHFQIPSSSLSLPKPMISRYSIVQSHHPNFTISYLIDSCGLSPDTAALTSQKLHLPSAERPNSILTLLREHGFTDTQISNLIRKCPLLLLVNPDILLPKFQFFLSIGISNTNLARTLTADPTLLTWSLEKQIIPSYNFLKSVLISDEKVAASLKRTSWVFLEDHKKNLVPNLNLLKEMDVPESCVMLLLTHFPEALMQKKENFAKLSKEIKEMGFNPKKTTFVLAIHVLSGEGNKSIYNRCCEVYKRWGWSDDDILMAFKKHPLCMILSEDKIMKTMDYLVNKMSWPSGMIVRCPVVLFFSLEKRIKPRCSVAKVLLMKGLIKRKLSLSTLLLPDEDSFLEKYVIKYELQVKGGGTRIQRCSCSINATDLGR